MPLQSRYTISIPNVSLPTYVFTSPKAVLSAEPVFVDTRAPKTCYLTYHEYRLWAQRLALGLQLAGLQPGDRVLLFSGNTLFFPVFLIGVIMAGGIFTGANPTYTVRELAYQLKDSAPRYLIAAEGSWETVLEAASSVGMSEDRIFAFDSGIETFEGRGTGIGNAKHWTALLASLQQGGKFEWEDLKTGEQLNRTIVLNYSSGTTGLPKGVEITHRNYVSHTEQTIYMAKTDPSYTVHNARSRWLCLLPMYHAAGQGIFCVGAPVRGIPVYIMPKFDFPKMLECVQNFRITDLHLVPPIVLAMVNNPATTSQYDLSSVERVGTGAAPLGGDICAELEKLWPEGRINMKQAWGMTE